MATNHPVTVAQRQRARLESMDAAALQQILLAYGALYRGLGGDIDALMLELESMGDITRGRVLRSDRYRRLMDDTNEKLVGFVAFLAVAMAAASAQGFQLGESAGRDVLVALGARPAAVSPAAIEMLAAFLDPGGELMKRIQMLAPYTAGQVRQSILDGVAQGLGPRVIAANIQRAFGAGLTDSLRMTRTVQIYSYRYATHASFIANGVEQWQWFSRLDPGRTCMSCVAQHGTLHPASETLNDHHNGLCIAIPVVGGAELVRERGEEWWGAQDEALQRQMMGAGKFEAWKDGAFEFGALSTTHDDPVYGIMRTAAPLKELVK